MSVETDVQDKTEATNTRPPNQTRSENYEVPTVAKRYFKVHRKVSRTNDNFTQSHGCDAQST